MGLKHKLMIALAVFATTGSPGFCGTPPAETYVTRAEFADLENRFEALVYGLTVLESETIDHLNDIVEDHNLLCKDHGELHEKVREIIKKMNSYIYMMEKRLNSIENKTSEERR